MYEHFTDRVRKVMQLAYQHAQRFDCEYICTEHVLLGLVEEGGGVAANVLKSLGIDLPRVRAEVEKAILANADMTATEPVGKPIPTLRLKTILEYASDAARNLYHNYVGTEHLLLGLLRDQEGVAAQILLNLGLKAEDVREEVINLLIPVADILPAEDAFPAETVHDLPAEASRAAAPRRTQGLEWWPVHHLPAEVSRAAEELEAQIEQLTQQKEEAVAAQDFDKALHSREQVDKLKRKKEAVLRDWAANYPVSVSWLTWNEGTVAKIAKGIRAEERWEDLPLLAEALEKAGCTDAEMLRHCRQPGKHGSRCWVVELLVGKASWPS